MAYPSKFKKLEAESGIPASETVLKLLNEHKSISQAARALNVSDAALLKFVEREKLSKEVIWMRVG